MFILVYENGKYVMKEVVDDIAVVPEVKPTIEDIQIKITDLKNQVEELETQVNNMS